MPTFQYSALDDGGSPVTGSVIGQDIQQAMETLKKRGLQVDRIEVARLINDSLSTPPQPYAGATPQPEVQPSYPMHPATEGTYGAAMSAQIGADATFAPRETPAEAAARHLGLLNPTTPQEGFYQADRNIIATKILGPVLLRAPLSQLGFFFRQLSTMLKAGVPIVHATATLMGQAKDPRMKSVSESVHASVKAGRPITEGLRRYPETVGPVLLAIVRIGEQGGFVDDALAQAADYVQREVELRNLYRRVTFYPKLIFVSSFIIIGMANTIISTVAPGSPGIQNPLAIGTWVAIASALIGIWLFLRIGLQNRAVKAVYDQIVLKVPVIGKTMHEMAMARFGRAFGAMYKAGVPVGEAMRLGAAACGNEALRVRMTPHFAALDHGAGMLHTFQMTGAFSPIVLDMVATGETTGNVDQMLSKVAEYYEDEAATKQMAVATVVGVVCFLIVAIYIGYIIIHFYTSYFGGIMKYAN